MPPRRILLLTEGHSNPRTGKTAANVARYCREECVAVLDKTQRGKRAQELLDAGGDLPVVGSIAESPAADTLLIGIAPPGGNIPAPWRPIILEAIQRGMNIVSGLHDFVSNDPEFAAAAEASGAKIHDVRKNNERDIAKRVGLRDECLRVHTVGHDCSIGKMVVAVEVARAINRRGGDAKFIATGQTGIMIEGDGLPIDCIVADFVAGAAEKLVLAHQHHEILLVEGQGSLVHPSYSGVTLSLLHGCAPHGLILCYETGRTKVGGFDDVPIAPLAEIMRIYETMANIHQPCRILGIAMNSRSLTAPQAAAERANVRAEFSLPVCDVLRDGPDELTDAVLAFHASRKK